MNGTSLAYSFAAPDEPTRKRTQYFEMLGHPWRTERRPTVPGIAEAADGLVALGCGTAQQWWDLCAMSGHQEWIDENTDLTITEQANLHADELYAWLRDQNVDDVRELASAFRIPNSPVGNGENVVAMDHYRERGTFVSNPAGFLAPAPPYRFTPALLTPPAPAPVPAMPAAAPVAHTPRLPFDFRAEIERIEIDWLQAALQQARFNQRKAAELLQLSYHQLRGYLRKYKLVGAGEENGDDEG